MGKGDIYMYMWIYIYMHLHTKHELALSYYIIVIWTNIYKHTHMLNKIKQSNTHSNVSSTELYTQILILLKEM